MGKPTKSEPWCPFASAGPEWVMCFPECPVYTDMPERKGCAITLLVRYLRDIGKALEKLAEKDPNN